MHLFQAYLVLLDPESFHGMPYFKLVMFGGVLAIVCVLWVVYDVMERGRQQQQQLMQQQQSLQDRLLGNARRAEG